MYAIKERVTEKLTRLFADSPNNSASAPASPLESPEVNSSSREKKPFISYFSFFVPLQGSDGSKTSKQHAELKHTRSLPCTPNGEDFYPQNESPDIYEDCSICSEVKEDKKNSPVEDEDCASGGSSCDSNLYAEATDIPSPSKLLTNVTDDTAFITSELYGFLESSIPNNVKGCRWILLYSTLKHGISLRTLIRNTSGHSGPCLLIAGDKQGAVFGGMLECPLKPTPKRKYQGTFQTFVFTTIYGQPRLFRPTGANRYYFMCMNNLLALGGGGNFALRLEGDLLSGTSGPCATFGNLCLAHNEEFELKNVELWGFSYASRYLT